MADYQHSEPCPNRCRCQAPADNDRSGHLEWPCLPTLFLFLPTCRTWCVSCPQPGHGCLPLHILHPGSSPNTLYQVVGGLPLHIGAELPGFLKILQDKDVGRKVDHVLLSTAKGQPQEVAEVVQGWPHDISWREGKEGQAGSRPCRVPPLS